MDFSVSDPIERQDISNTGWRYFVASVLAFCLAVTLTDGYFWGDSADYVDSITAYFEGRYYDFVDFGHVIWRPLGWLLWMMTSDQSITATWRLEIFNRLQWINLACGLFSSILFANILQKVIRNFLVSNLILLAFIVSHAFLNFSQTGASYGGALLFLLLAIRLSVVCEKQAWFTSFCAGMALAISVGFWIAFIWVVPAVLLLGLIFCGVSRSEISRSVYALIGFVIGTVIVFGSAMIVMNISSLDALLAWIRHSSHGNETFGFMRAAFGFPRTFIYMASGGAEIKRLIFGDPYNPVYFWNLVNETLIKVAVFYAVIAVVFIRSLAYQTSRKAVLFALSSIVPHFAFSIFFDGAAIERFLPVLPATLLALGIYIDREASKTIRCLVALTVMLVPIINFTAMMRWRNEPAPPEVISRAMIVDYSAKASDVVFLVTWQDELMNFNRSFPTHRLNRYGNLRYAVVATPGLSQTATWREEFSLRVLRAWEQDKAVWISIRALSRVPKAEWNWIEGDDKNIRWGDFHDFFSQLEFGLQFGDNDGFISIPQSELNKSYLREFAVRYPGTIH